MEQKKYCSSRKNEKCTEDKFSDPQMKLLPERYQMFHFDQGLNDTTTNGYMREWTVRLEPAKAFACEKLKLVIKLLSLDIPAG